jgi:hypothetical protein
MTISISVLKQSGCEGGDGNGNGNVHDDGVDDSDQHIKRLKPI